MRIAVAGATGRVGRHVVDMLEDVGHEVVAISRSRGVDIITGEGLAAALEDVNCIIDASSGSSPDEAAATQFFTTAARNLLSAGERAGVGRLVVVSIIGIDRFTAGYMAAKVAQERALLAGPIPARVLRAAQFHEFVGQIVEWGRRGGVARVPRMRTQLVAARTVARALSEMATAPGPAWSKLAGPPFPEIAGPQAEELVDAARRLVARRGDPVRIDAVSNPSDPDDALYQSGALLPGPKAALAGPTFDEWLDATYPTAAHGEDRPGA